MTNDIDPNFGTAINFYRLVHASDEALDALDDYETEIEDDPKLTLLVNEVEQSTEKLIQFVLEHYQNGRLPTQLDEVPGTE